MAVEKIGSIIFVVNSAKPKAGEIADRLKNLAVSAGVDCAICGEYPLDEKKFEGRDACCVIGGDGTVLSAVPPVAKFGIPVFGINLGKLGFLTTFTDEISDGTFLSLLRGEGRILERALLSADFRGVRRDALNEFAIKNSNCSTAIRLRVSADGEFIADYFGDGLIFSTPTGSTAYNLSAGGPLVHPKAKVFVMTPICPHTLSNRSVVYDSNAKIEVECIGGEALIIADGNEFGKMENGDVLRLESAPETLKFMKGREHSHFKILRSKLGWAENPRRE